MELLSILGIALIILGIDAAIELALLSSMVGYVLTRHAYFIK